MICGSLWFVSAEAEEPHSPSRRVRRPRLNGQGPRAICSRPRVGIGIGVVDLTSHRDEIAALVGLKLRPLADKLELVDLGFEGGDFRVHVAVDLADDAAHNLD